MNDQSRASAWLILRWAEALFIRNILIENIPEFMDWGPLSAKGRPIKKLKGTTFRAFIESLKSLNYHVDYRVINCANYGDPTTRHRLFIMASKARKPVWPEPTHLQHGADMFGTYQPWKTAKEIIDWDHKGKSIYARKKPLSPNTMRRIMVGLTKFGGGAFVIGQQTPAAPRSVDRPLPTVAGAGAISLVQPFIFEMEHTGLKSGDKHRCHNIDRPLPTVTGKGQWGLIEPYLVEFHGTGEDGRERVRSLDEPMPTVLGANVYALAEPMLIQMNGTDPGQLDHSAKSINEPVPTLTGGNKFALAQPYIVEYYGSATAVPITDPLPTVTSKSRFALADPIIMEDKNGKRYLVDVLFRMLSIKELAAATSFPADYIFKGTHNDVVKQIGNAVPVNTARALTHSLLS
jgi:DNA (cytosine-5)-methyltransferase 1